MDFDFCASRSLLCLSAYSSVPTQILPATTHTEQMSNSKAAKKAAAQADLARARQWANERRGSKSPTPNSSKPFERTNECDFPSTTANRRSLSPKRKIVTKDPTGQYHTTSSRESKAEALAHARSKAREWSIQHKREMGITGDALFMVVPETEDDEDDVETWSECDDDFNTADNEPTDNITPTVVASSKAWNHELILLRNDTKNVLDRLQHISSENIDLTFIKNDIRNIYDRMKHMSENEINAEEPRVMDQQADILRCVIPFVLFAVFVQIAFY